MIKLGTRKLRVLDFDTECRPMHYSEWRPESQITAIAWSWVGEDRVEVELLEQDLSNERAMLDSFLEAYDMADMVTGHYIRKHDLPLINDHCVRYGYPPISTGRILVQDTQQDFVKVKCLGLSQDNLSTMLRLSAEKHHMSGDDWRRANSLDAAGAELARKRVVGDVLQHKQLRQALLDIDALKPPRYWP